MAVARRFCPHCDDFVASQTLTNHLLHLALSVVTAGFWLPIWFLVAMTAKYQCPKCGGNTLAGRPVAAGRLLLLGVAGAIALVGLLSGVGWIAGHAPPNPSRPTAAIAPAVRPSAASAAAPRPAQPAFNAEQHIRLFGVPVAKEMVTLQLKVPSTASFPADIPVQRVGPMLGEFADLTIWRVVSRVESLAPSGASIGQSWAVGFASDATSAWPYELVIDGQRVMGDPDNPRKKL